MTTLVLAAGYATRLYPLTKNFPKPLLPVGGKTVLDWLIDDVETIDGIDRYVIVSGHTFLPFFQKWKEAKKLSRPVDLIDDGSTCNENRLGAVRDMLLAIEKEKIDDDLLVLAGDNVLEFSLALFVRYFREKKSSCVLRYELADIAKLRRTGVAEIGKDDLVISMEEKPAEPKSTWAIPPFYCFRREDLGQIGRAVSEGCGTDAPGSFIAWACTRFPVRAMVMPARRFDIGTPESYEAVRKEYKGLKITL